MGNETNEPLTDEQLAKARGAVALAKQWSERYPWAQELAQVGALLLAEIDRQREWIAICTQAVEGQRENVVSEHRRMLAQRDENVALWPLVEALADVKLRLSGTYSGWCYCPVCEAESPINGGVPTIDIEAVERTEPHMPHNAASCPRQQARALVAQRQHATQQEGGK